MFATFYLLVRGNGVEEECMEDVNSIFVHRVVDWHSDFVQVATKSIRGAFQNMQRPFH